MALEAPSEQTPPALAGLKIFPMRVTLQPDGLGELLQWGPAPTFMALTCRWRSRPQHQKATLYLGTHGRRLCSA